MQAFNDDLTFAEQYELRERTERIKSLANEYGEYAYLKTGDRAIYHVDFKARKLVSKELIKENETENKALKITNVSKLRLDFWFSLNRRQQRQLSSIGYLPSLCENVMLMDLKRVTKSKKIISAWQALQDALA